MDQRFECFSAKVFRPNLKETILELNLRDEINDRTEVEFWAAAPATFGASFSGSGLPYSDSEMAFCNTPNKGKLFPTSKRVLIHLKTPNSYYSHLGTRQIPACVTVKLTSNGTVYLENIELGSAVPNRTLTYPSSRSSCLFYDRSLLTTQRSQEKILRSSGYPSCISENNCNNFTLFSEKNFWGGAVPLG
jgi:hypothetical protein